MLCSVYKSRLLEDAYLYITKRDDFSAVPEALLKTFGKPVFVLVLNMNKRDSLAMVDIDKVKADLIEKGYFLQLPPPKENFLDEHKANLKKQGKPVNE